jgi:hypothetical protein
MYYIGSYTCVDGIFKGACIMNAHTTPPVTHPGYNGKDMGVGLVGSYEGDSADLTATVFQRNRSRGVNVTLRKLADI